MIMIIIIFLLNIPVYSINILDGYKTNLLLLLLAEISRLPIIIQINAGSLKEVIFNLYTLVIFYYFAL